MDKYKKLTEDLKEAREMATKEATKVNDNGTANLDSAFLILKGWREEDVLEAIKNAGLWSAGKRKWIGTGYFISINVGQANKRTIARDMFITVLGAKGYEILSFDKMD